MTLSEKMGWTPPKCRRCKARPIARNGYCHGCDSHPVRVVLIGPDDCDLCNGWQEEIKLPDGRPCTMVYRVRSRSKGYTESKRPRKLKIGATK